MACVTSSAGREPRASPPSLYLSSQVAFIRALHARALSLECDYVQGWLESQLSYAHRALAEAVDIRSGLVDPAEVVARYEAAARLRRVRQAARLRKTLERHGGVPARGARAGAGGVASRTRSKMRAGGVAKASTTPLNKKAVVESVVRYMAAKPLVKGIAEASSERPRDYIEYRKCRFVEDIRSVRLAVAARLSPVIRQDLMDTMVELARYNGGHEAGLLSLQAMLTSEAIRHFRIAPPKFHRNFAVTHVSSFYNCTPRPVMTDNLETRIGTTVLHFSLLQATGLTHLDLRRCACDSLLRVVARTALNLRHLVISGSVVSDQGLLDLAGVEPGAMRPHLGRECKRRVDASAKLVKDVSPKWWTSGPFGLRSLVHLEAEDLLNITWPTPGSLMRYYDSEHVPLDSGFVALLLFLPELKVCLAEVAARSVLAFHRNHVKWHRATPTLKLEAISDSQLTPPVQSVLRLVCPELSHLKVDWFESYTHHSHHHREEWLSGLAHMPKLVELRVADVDFKSEKLQTHLPAFGPNLTHLALKEIWKFRYSNLRAIKQYCPHLKFFSLVMTTKNVLATVSRIQVDKDHNIQLNSNERYPLAQLEDLHLSGPFGHEVVQYLLMGAEKLKRLSLGIEWLDPAFCDNQPLTRQDLLGREYLEEIVSVNPLTQLEELHLLAQYRRGRRRLNRVCFDYVIAQFPQLKHLGSFACWNLSDSEVSEIVAEVRLSNLELVLEENLQASTSSGGHGEAKFEYKYVPNQHALSCAHVPPKKDTNGLLASFLDAMGGPPHLLDDEASSSSDESYASDLDEDNLMEEVGVPEDLEDELDDANEDFHDELMLNDPQVCLIM